jgi:transaldolase
MTALYLDSANTQEWAQISQLGLSRRVTCNPLLIQAAGLPVTMATLEQLVQESVRLGLEELHLQAWPNEQGDWLPVAQAIANLGDHIVVKLPAVAAAMVAAAQLKQKGYKILITAISNPVHALWASQIGADYVAPYVGRLQEAGVDTTALLNSMVIQQKLGGPIVLAASIRSLEMLNQVIQTGVAAVTIQKKLIHEGLTDPQTSLAVQQFEAARNA